jgi:hypothetical protein
MTISIETINKYTLDLKNDLAKKRQEKANAEKFLAQTNEQITLTEGALQFADVLMKDSEQVSISEPNKEASTPKKENKA